MKLEHVWVPEMATARQASRLSRDWPFAAALVLSAIFWLLAWYGVTAESVVAIWIRSETFTHGFLIVPISAWMIWRQRHAVAALDPRPNFLALPLLALLGFVWLLGQLASAGVVQQYGLVLMIPLLVWSILGNQVVRALAFPLFFLLFAVPFGEFLVPSLMAHTADFTVFSLRLTGIPVYREGQFFTIPSGSWSVVEACGGLRYLIASVTLGFLYAYLSYRSFTRRAIFVAASVIVPIVANWLRAYMIVMIGHLSGMKYAIGVDHLIYGWLFFGVVMLILFWIGSFWREDLDPHQASRGSIALAPRDKPALGMIMAATVASVVTVAVWPVAASRIEGTGSFPPPVLQAPLPAGGWQPVAGRLTDWTPRFFNPRARLEQVYAQNGSRAGLYIGYYRNQRQGAELITSGNTLAPTTNNAWRNIGETPRTVVFDSEKLPVIETTLRGRARDLLVWHWYWVDGQYTVNPYWVKLLQAKSRLFGRGDDGAIVVVYTEMDTTRTAAASRLRDFVHATLPAISRNLDHAR